MWPTTEPRPSREWQRTASTKAYASLSGHRGVPAPVLIDAAAAPSVGVATRADSIWQAHEASGVDCPPEKPDGPGSLVSRGFEETFGVDGRHAAHAGGGDCLPVAEVDYIARSKDSGHRCLRRLTRKNDVSLRQVELSLEK